MPETLVGRTILVTFPPGSPGAPPHRHPGPIYGYVLTGAITFELEGQPERVVLTVVGPDELEARKHLRVSQNDAVSGLS